MAYKILIFNRKGGVGKTTSAVSIAGELTKNFGKKVLLCDFDSSSNLSDSIAISESPIQYFSEMLLEFYDSDDEIKGDIHDAIVASNFPNLDVIPAESKRMSKAERGLPRLDNFRPQFAVKKFFEDIEDEYDYILIDSAQGSASILTQCAMEYCDNIVCPTDDSKDGMAGIVWVMSKIKSLVETNPDLKILAIYMNRTKKRKEVVRIMDEVYMRTYPDVYIPSMVRDSAAVTKARIKAAPLCYFVPSEPITQDFNEITAEIVRRLEG